MSVGGTRNVACQGGRQTKKGEPCGDYEKRRKGTVAKLQLGLKGTVTAQAKLVKRLGGGGRKEGGTN